MTEEDAVVNVRGEISDDQHKIKSDKCNGGAHENGSLKAVNGDVGGEFGGADSGDKLDAGNSGGSDLGENGADVASEDHEIKVDESQVAVSTEAEREEVINSNEQGSADASISAVSNGSEAEITGISNGTVSVDVDVAGESNGVGSVAVFDVSVDKKDDTDNTSDTVVEEVFTEENKVHDRELESAVEDVQNGVENENENKIEIRDYVDGVNGGEVNGIQNSVVDRELGDCAVEDEIRYNGSGVRECENIDSAAGVSGGEKEVVAEGEEVSHMNSHKKDDSVAIQDGVVDKELSKCAVENDISDDVNGIPESEDVAGGVEVSGGQKEVLNAVVEVADLSNSNQELDSAAVQNGVVHKEVSEYAEESEKEKEVADLNNSSQELDSVAAQNGVVHKEVSECAEESEKLKEVVDLNNSNQELDSVAVQNLVVDKEVTECAEEREKEKEVADLNNINQELDSAAVQNLEADKEVSECAEESEKEKEVADLNNSNEELDSVVIQNGVVDKEVSECAEESEISGVVDGVPATDVEELKKDGPNSSAEEAQAQIESVDSGAGDAGDGRNLVEGTLSDEKDVKTMHEVNGLVDAELIESAEKIEIPVAVSATSGVKEGASEDAQFSSEVQNVSDAVVDKSIVVGEDIQDVQSEFPEKNEISIEGEPDNQMERCEEESGHEVVPDGENLSAVSNNTDVTVDHNIVSDLNDNTVEREAETSAVNVPDMKNNAVESEAEPSNNAPEGETEPSVEGEIPVEGDGGNHGDEETRRTQVGSTTDALEGQNTGSEVVKRPFYYLIRLPRYDDENIEDQINNAFHEVDEKTKIRDAIRAESNNKRAICRECSQAVRDAVSAEKTARDLLKSKRQEMDSIQSTMNRLNNAISVGDIDGKIRNMEHMIQHETLPLKEEKQLIRQIKQLKQNREELSSSMGKQDQSQQVLDHKDSIEEHFKQLQLLKKEVESLKNEFLKAEAATKAARKKYDDENNQLSELHARFRAADDVRQEAFVKSQTLKNQLREKRKHFYEYKNAARKAQELAAIGKREELQRLCIDQVEGVMELWNKNDEFRRDYVRCNTRRTLKRLQTLDGRSLGPDEEPPVIPNPSFERASKNTSILPATVVQENKSTPTESVSIKVEPVPKVVEQSAESSQTSKSKKPAKRAPLEKPVVAASRWGDEPEDPVEEPVRTREEEEMILKAEQARKEEEAAKLKEKRRLEEIEKAKEAMERKRRNAEKTQQRVALKAQKEAEQKEKEREKRARKKERRKAASTSTNTAVNDTEQESAPSSETLTRTTEECNQSEKPAVLTRRPQKQSQVTRQTKAKSLPLPLRNRGKRRVQPWMWVLIAFLAVVVLFYIGNISFWRSWLPGGSGY